MIWKTLGPLTIAAVLVLSAAACGGGGGGSNDARTDANNDALVALLQSMALTSSDLPEGLQEAAAITSTNQDMAESAADPDARLQELEAAGRRMGYEYDLAPLPDAPAGMPIKGFENHLSIYTTAEGAGESLNDALGESRTRDWTTLYPDLTAVEMKELSLPDGADEGGWFRVTGLDENGNLVIDDQVAFRVGSVRALLRVVSAFESTDRNVYADQVSTWGTAMAGRISQMLESGEAAGALGE